MKTCDSDDMCREICKRVAKPACALHDVEDRLPEDAVAYLNALMPCDKASKKTAQKAYDDMLRYLVKHGALFFNESRTSVCDACHGTQSPDLAPDQRG